MDEQAGAVGSSLTCRQVLLAVWTVWQCGHDTLQGMVGVQQQAQTGDLHLVALLLAETSLKRLTPLTAGTHSTAQHSTAQVSTAWQNQHRATQDSLQCLTLLGGGGWARPRGRADTHAHTAWHRVGAH